MTIKEQLKFILKLSGKTQAQLAGELGVTFAALNRWVNGKAKPRPKARACINKLYFELTGQKHIPETVELAKLELIKVKNLTHKNVLQEILRNPDIQDSFVLALTYNSNRIEGSTLSEGETAAILFENAALSKKSLVEQLEAKNHQSALNYLFEHVKNKLPLNGDFVLKLHSILMNSIHPDAGLYRNHGVRIVGAYVPTANYLKIPKLMDELLDDVKTQVSDPLIHSAIIHSRFEKIHPFADGNGRVGRLLLAAMLLKENFPPAVIRQENRLKYLKYLNQSQMKEDHSNLIELLYDSVLEGYRILERN